MQKLFVGLMAGDFALAPNAQTPGQTSPPAQ
jgi:hypothetical protein